MLKTLRTQPERERERILAELVSKLMPNPGTEAQAGKVLSDLEVAALQEITRKLHVDPQDRSPGTLARVYEFLAAELAASVTGEREKEARQRLGERGELRSDLYRVKFGGSFEVFEEFGTRRSHVETAIRHSDANEHLLPQRLEEKKVSLFAKTNGEPGSPDLFTLLVRAERSDDALTVGSVWKVYHSDVDLRGASTPLEILRRFVDVFGLFFRVGNSFPGRFFLHEAVPLSPDHPSTDLITIIDKPSTYFGDLILRVSPLDVAEILIAYVIDMERYGAGLKRHR